MWRKERGVRGQEPHGETGGASRGSTGGRASEGEEIKEEAW